MINFPVFPAAILTTVKDWSIKLAKMSGRVAFKDTNETISGVYTFKTPETSALGGGDLVIKGRVIATTTNDGADTSGLDLQGGGNSPAITSKERGARLILFGNESSGQEGNAYLDAGNVTGSSVRIRQNDQNLATFNQTSSTFTKEVIVPDDVYDSGWNGDLSVPTKNAVYDAIQSGTYTPTLTNVANLDAITAYEAQYLKVGGVATVSGQFDADATTTNTVTQMRISLPFASNFSADRQLGGVSAVRTTAVTSRAGTIYADTTNDTALVYWFPTQTGNSAYFFTFTYRII